MELVNMLKKIKYVFTKEYREEVEYYEFLEKMKPSFKLNGNSESIDDKVKRLEKSKISIKNSLIKLNNYMFDIMK